MEHNIEVLWMDMVNTLLCCYIIIYFSKSGH